jgi:hypothetical protein
MNCGLDAEPEISSLPRSKIKVDMKKIVISITMVCMCTGFAKASIVPGAPLDEQGGTTYTLYDDHTPPDGDSETYFDYGTYSTYQLNLNIPVVNGDVILLENGPIRDKANWSDVLTFRDPDTLATLTSYDGPDAATFWADYVPSDNVVYIQETGGPYTIYTAVNDSGGFNIYQIDSVVVPESTTMIAGAILLLPFGTSTLRILRKNRVV